MADVAVQVAPVERRQAGIADHVAARDRGEAVGVAEVDVRLHVAGAASRTRGSLGLRVGRGCPRSRASRSWRPAATPVGGRHEVDLLARALADVADHEVARGRGRTRTATGCAGRRRRSPARRRQRGRCAAACRAASRVLGVVAGVVGPASVAGRRSTAGRRARTASWPPLWLPPRGAPGPSDHDAGRDGAGSAASGSAERRNSRTRSVRRPSRRGRRRSGPMLA